MIAETIAALLALAGPAPTPVRLPGTVAGNVVVLTPEDDAHRRMRVLVDTGGFDLIDAEAAARLGLARSPIDLGGANRETVVFPRWIPPSLPPPSTRWLIARPAAIGDGFAVPVDATLGPSWLLDRTIVVDYPHQTIESVVAPARVEPGVTTGTYERVTAAPLSVAFGRPALPSLPPYGLVTIDVTVAGERLTMLLDTGSTARVHDPVRRMMPDAEPVHQICLIDPSLLEKWHREHPAWTYVESAFDVAGDPNGTASPAILVPELRVGAAPAMPTWFVARRDASTFAALSKQLGKPVVGDLGGDALRAWRVTFDLKHERLLLE